MSAGGRIPALGVTTLLALVPASHALMVAVYAKADKADVETMRTIAREVKARHAALADSVGAGEVVNDAVEASSLGEGYSVKVAETSVLSAAFSVPEGVAAYFLTDGALVYRGFEMKGASVRFVQTGSDAFAPALAKGALPVEAPPAKVYATALIGASLGHGGLQVGYSVAAPGRVSIETFGVNGERLGKWIVSEATAGEYRRVFSLRRPAKGPVFLRWSTGEARAVRTVPSASRD